VLLVKDDAGHTFGAFMPFPWEKKGNISADLCRLTPQVSERHDTVLLVKDVHSAP